MIGIFGDSYAHENGTIGWPTFLSQLYNEEFENFALSGSSLPWSYDLLCGGDLSKYSKVIFVSTEPRRLHFRDKKTNTELLWNGRDADSSINLNSIINFLMYPTRFTKKTGSVKITSSDKEVLKCQ